MTPREMVILTRYVKACCPQQQIDEYTPDAWHDIIGDLALADCREAVKAIATRQPFVAPAEIAAEVKRIRSERLDGFVYVPCEGDHDPQVYLANRREQIEAVASGRRAAAPAIEGAPDPEQAAKLRALCAGAFPRPPARDQS